MRYISHPRQYPNAALRNAAASAHPVATRASHDGPPDVDVHALGIAQRILGATAGIFTVL